MTKTKALANSGLTWQKALPYILLIGGVLGMIASFALTYDKIQVLQDPNYSPGCNINPVLSCGSVMSTPQANLFGVPNTVFGLIGFSMLAMFGVLLLAGAVVKKWVWLGAQVFATTGVVFMHYLFIQSVFQIHAICPWCFAVWMITIPAFFGITLYNIRLFKLTGSNSHIISKTTAFINSYCNEILLVWYLTIFGILLVKFWYYWSTLL